MKGKILPIITALILTGFYVAPVSAQWTANESIIADEVQPEFRGGGADTFADWVKKRVIFFQDFYTAKGVVELSLTVDKNGKIRDVEVETSHDPELTDAVLKAIDKAPKMTPGTKNGKASEFRLKATIDFDSYSNPETDLDPHSSKKPIVKPCFRRPGKIYDSQEDEGKFRETVLHEIEKRQSLKNIETGKVLVYFVVNRGGYIEGVTIRETSNLGLIKLVVQAMYSCPKWYLPGNIDGEPVKVSFELPIIVLMERITPQYYPNPLPEKL